MVIGVPSGSTRLPFLSVTAGVVEQLRAAPQPAASWPEPSVTGGT